MPTQHTSKANRDNNKKGSIWPSTLAKWQVVQFCTWSSHVWPFQPFNNNTLKSSTFCTPKITCLRCIQCSWCCLLQGHIMSQLEFANLRLTTASSNGNINVKYLGAGQLTNSYGDFVICMQVWLYSIGKTWYGDNFMIRHHW